MFGPYKSSKLPVNNPKTVKLKRAALGFKGEI
jgi:hypothetical protein